MKMHLASSESTNLIRACNESGLTVGDQSWSKSVIVTPERITEWPLNDFESIDATHFSRIIESDPELIIVGTGSHQRFPDAAIFQEVIQRQIGIEFMTTQAACRTYNIVAMEGRKVLAALIVPDLQAGIADPGN